MRGASAYVEGCNDCTNAGKLRHPFIDSCVVGYTTKLMLVHTAILIYMSVHAGMFDIDWLYLCLCKQASRFKFQETKRDRINRIQLVPSGTSKMYDDCTAYKVTSNVQPGSDGHGIIGLQSISPFVLGCIHCKMSYFCLSNDQCVVLMPGFPSCVIQGHIFQVTEKVIATESLVDSPAKVQAKEAVATPNPLPLVRYLIILCENDGAHHICFVLLG